MLVTDEHDTKECNAIVVADTRNIKCEMLQHNSMALLV